MKSVVQYSVYTMTEDGPVYIAPDTQPNEIKLPPFASKALPEIAKIFKDKKIKRLKSLKNDLTQSQIIILFLDDKFLSKKYSFVDLLLHASDKQNYQHSIPSLRPFASDNQDAKKFLYWPIITISIRDLVDIYTLESYDSENYRIPSQDINLDHRCKFLDSSIWHRYVHCKWLDSDNMVNAFKIDFTEVMTDILGYHQKQLYFTHVARATLEFHLRILKNSFISKVNPASGHPEAVTPFKFHSETFFKRKTKKIINRFKQKGPGKLYLKKSLQWEILIVDDQADVPISSSYYGNSKENKNSQAQDKPCKISKTELIEDYLRPIQKLKADFLRTKKAKNKIAKSESIQDTDQNIIHNALQKLKEKKYDLILLDYLLGEKMENRTSYREYGHEFLFELIEDSIQKNPSYKKGPLGKYWIFPFSSFPFALLDKLRQLGADNTNHIWRLSGGGDPISTPNLFCFFLFQFMEEQIASVYKTDKLLESIIHDFIWIEELENWGIALYHKFNELQLNLYLIRQDEDQSTFAKTIYETVQKAGFENFIKEMLTFLDLISGGIRNQISYQNFKEQWNKIQKTFQPNYPKTIQQIHRKLNATIYKGFIQAQKKIEQKRNARKLYLQDMQLLELPIQSLLGMTELRELWLNGNRLESLPPDLNKLKKLKEIHLAYNNFTRFPESIRALAKIKNDGKPQLEVIDLSNNPLNLEVEYAYSAEEVLKMMESLKKQENQDPATQIADIKKYIKKDSLPQAISMLEALLKKKPLKKVEISKEMKRGLELHQYHLNTIETRKSRNFISGETYDVEKKRIVNHLLDFSDMLLEIFSSAHRPDHASS